MASLAGFSLAVTGILDCLSLTGVLLDGLSLVLVGVETRPPQEPSDWPPKHLPVEQQYHQPVSKKRNLLPSSQAGPRVVKSKYFHVVATPVSKLPEVDDAHDGGCAHTDTEERPSHFRLFRPVKKTPLLQPQPRPLGVYTIRQARSDATLRRVFHESDKYASVFMRVSSLTLEPKNRLAWSSLGKPHAVATCVEDEDTDTEQQAAGLQHCRQDVLQKMIVLLHAMAGDGEGVAMIPAPSQPQQ